MTYVALNEGIDLSENEPDALGRRGRIVGFDRGIAGVMVAHLQIEVIGEVGVQDDAAGFVRANRIDRRARRYPASQSWRHGRRSSLQYQPPAIDARQEDQRKRRVRRNLAKRVFGGHSLVWPAPVEKQPKRCSDLSQLCCRNLNCSLGRAGLGPLRDHPNHSACARARARHITAPLQLRRR